MLNIADFYLYNLSLSRQRETALVLASMVMMYRITFCMLCYITCVLLAVIKFAK